MEVQCKLNGEKLTELSLVYLQAGPGVKKIRICGEY